MKKNTENKFTLRFNDEYYLSKLKKKYKLAKKGRAEWFTFEVYLASMLEEWVKGRSTETPY